MKAHLKEQYEVKWVRHGWTGANSHAAREKGSAELRQKIASLPPQSDENLNMLLAHSHGGNLALMALTNDSETRKTISMVVCLSTPFIEAKERKSLPLEMLSDFPLGSWLVWLACAQFLAYAFSQMLGVHWLYAIVLVAVWLGLTSVLMLYWRVTAEDLDPASVLRPYEYSRIPAHVLSLRTKFDEALSTVRGLSLFGAVSSVLPVMLAAASVVLMILPPLILVLGLPIFFIINASPPGPAIAWMFPLGMALMLLNPFAVLPTQLVWAILRALAMGEDPRVGIHFRFKLVIIPNKLLHLEERVVARFPRSSWFRFRFNHSYLHSQEETAIPIAAFVRGYRFDPQRASTVHFPPDDSGAGYVVSTSEWIGRCVAELRMLHSTGSMATQHVATQLSKQREVRLQSPEVAAQRYEPPS
ncbi:hypothetical protein [Variovorax sp. J22R115]|uniref:hypothetical protein n=1 Tax=Variovorax sp. J22R115 TaxID=3053509 RepID=UPI002577EC6B|nr:hypothetical protein [Variovorax sp. J22R115]MDM0049930.1 hypothetical protein [Variovorax sp. J22R115]